MKIIQHIYLFFLLFVGQQTFGQSPIPAIDSLKIIHENGETKVVCYTTFTSGDCDLADYTIHNENNIITLSVNFTVGAATYICHSVDTISLGTLTPGDYDLEGNLTIGSSEVIVHQKTVSFTVGELNVGLIDAATFNIYPNPTQKFLSIESEKHFKQVEIISIFGQIVLNAEMVEQTIDVSDLEEGFYFVRLTDEMGKQISKRMLKTK